MGGSSGSRTSSPTRARGEPDVCYLEDLFTDPAARGRGAGRSLIGGVVSWAREQGCGAVYWQTHQANSTARRLYDDVATFEGFIVYRIPLDG